MTRWVTVNEEERRTWNIKPGRYKRKLYFSLQVEIEKTQLLKVVAVKTEDE